MYGYAGSSASAGKLQPLTDPSPTTNAGGLGAQTAAVTQPTGTLAGLLGLVSGLPSAVHSLPTPLSGAATPASALAAGMPAMASAGRGGYGTGPRYGFKPTVVPEQVLV